MSASTIRYCRGCSTRLARDNQSGQCAACSAKTRHLLASPPALPPQFWENPRLRDALDSWHMGAVISAYRNHPSHGYVLRQKIVAGWVGITQAQLSRIENGPAITDLGKLTHWATTLSIPAHLLWFQLPTQRPNQPAAHQHMVAPPPQSPKTSHTVTQWDCHSITFTALQITGEDLSITRRDALAAGASTILVGAGLTELLQQWLLPINQDKDFATRGSDFSAAELASLEGLIKQFRTWSRDGYGMLIRKAAVAQLNDVTDRLREIPPEPATWRAFRVAAELSEVVAAILWDHGLHSSAQRYYVLSVQLAKLANDDGHAATVLAALARQCYDLGHPREGLEIVQLAQYGSRGTATALLRSMLATREAWGYALLGESQAFTRAVGLAEEYFSEGPSEGDHRRVQYFDASELAGVIGGRYRDLARHEPQWTRRAHGYIQEALDSRHPSMLRVHCFDLIGLARTHLIDTDPEQACALVRQAIQVGQPWMAGRVGSKLRDFHQEASQYAGISVVRDTRDLIRELTSPTVRRQE